MGLTDKMFGLRRDDPRVREYHAAQVEYDSNADVEPDRYRAARKALPDATLTQLDNETSRHHR